MRLFAFFFLAALQIARADDGSSFVIDSANTREWNKPQTAQKVFGNTYYVGTAGLSAILIDTGAGLILFDGDLVQSVPQIEASIASLGFDVQQIKYIANSHAHFDHAGGIAGLQRDSGATVLASPSGATALHEGHVVADDPQFGYTDVAKFPPVSHIEKVYDGEIITLGSTTITAHFTPGHTPGSTTWTWRSCEGDRCVDVVYADSLNSISAPGYHYLPTKEHGDLSERFRDSIHTVAALPCDILLTVHPNLSDTATKLARLKDQPSPNPFIDRSACAKYAGDAEKMLDQRIADEKAGKL